MRQGELAPSDGGVPFQAGVGDELAAVGGDGDHPQAAVVVHLGGPADHHVQAGQAEKNRSQVEVSDSPQTGP